MLPSMSYLQSKDLRVTEVGTTTLLVSDIRLSVRYEQTA
jgi:hypothetical protein